MRRRGFIAGVAAVPAARPLAAPAQRTEMPIVGFLSPRSADRAAPVVAAFREGLRNAGYLEGRNVGVEYRFAEDDYDRLSVLAAELVRRRVSVIVAGSTPSARAAKAATTTIPIVFTTGLGLDALVAFGIIASVNRPGGNVTGATFLSDAWAAKELELLRELVPASSLVAMLVNPANPFSVVQIRDAQAAAPAVGLRLQTMNVTNEDEFERAIAGFSRLGVAAFFLGSDPVFDSRPERIVALAAGGAVPAVYYIREFVEAGGLMSYGGSVAGMYRQVGVYVGRILSGALPSDLPIQQPTTFQLVINLRAARAIGLTIPPVLLVRADEVIE